MFSEDAADGAVLKCRSAQAPTLRDRINALAGAAHCPSFTRLRRNARRPSTLAAFPGCVFVAWDGAQDGAALWRATKVPARVLAIRGASLTLRPGATATHAFGNPRYRTARAQQAHVRSRRG